MWNSLYILIAGNRLSYSLHLPEDIFLWCDWVSNWTHNSYFFRDGNTVNLFKLCKSVCEKWLPLINGIKYDFRSYLAASKICQIYLYRGVY